MFLICKLWTSIYLSQRHSWTMYLFNNYIQMHVIIYLFILISKFKLECIQVKGFPALLPSLAVVTTKCKIYFPLPHSECDVNAIST